MTEHKNDHAGDDKAPDEAKPGELTAEELAKVSGGAARINHSNTNAHFGRAPTANTFKKP